MLPSILAVVFAVQNLSQPLGHLIIVGGGPMPPNIAEKALLLAGGKGARIVIIPQASAWVGRAGARSLAMWQKAGARRATVLDLNNRDTALAALKKADLIWMPGGSQARLMQALQERGLADAIRERFRQGATVGGTSAGAAVMSQIMLMGAPRVRGVAAAVELAGLGLWPEVIVDQHYLRRHRYPRLLSAVLHHPDKPGIGIDESTAVVVYGRRFEVIGTSKVMVLDARRVAKVLIQRVGAGADKVAIYTLKAGMKFDLDKGIVAP
jgi:cyanophycinase